MSIAPHPSRATRTPATEAEIVWTLGNGGRIEVLLHQGNLDLISAECRVSAPTRGARDLADGSPTCTSLLLQVIASDDDEVRLESQTPLGARNLSLIRRGNSMLLITNIPEMLGVRGGAYQLRDSGLEAVWAMAHAASSARSDRR